MQIRLGLVLGLSILVGLAPAAQSNDARVMLESARKIELVDGDLARAIVKYQEIVDRFGKSNRSAAAEALVRLGECYRMLRDDRARASFERVLREYADQPGSVSIAKSRLAAEGSPATEAVMPRLVCEQCGDPYGSVSTDGDLMALSGVMDGLGDISIREMSSSKVTPLQLEGSGSNAAGIALSPIFSPDKKEVVYAWSMGQKGTELRLVSTQPKSKPRVLVANPEFRYIEPAAWGSQGTLIALGQRHDQTWDLLKVSPADGRLTQLKSLQWRVASSLAGASLSSDGRFVAYEALTNNPSGPLPGNAADSLERQIYVLAIDGSGEVALTNGAGTKHGPVWTPDSRHVLYNSNVSGTWDLWAQPVAAGKPAGEALLVKKDIGNVKNVGITRTGIYHYYQGRMGILRTTIASLEGETKKALDDAVTLIGTKPAWSPDGKRLALMRPRTDETPGVDIVVHTLGTREERQFKRPGIADYPLIWFQDGDGLLALLREGKDQVWYKLDLQSGSFQRLALNRGDPNVWTHPNVKALSRDGKTLYLAASASERDPELDRIVALDFSTGKYRDVFRLQLEKSSLPRTAQEFAIGISPDGRTLAFAYRDRGLELVRLGIVGTDGAGYRPLVEPLPAHNIRNKLAWSPDSRWIYLTSQPGPRASLATDDHRVIRVSVDGGAVSPTGLDIDGLDAFDVSPDGKRLAFSTLRPEGAGNLHWTLDVGSILKRPVRAAGAAQK